MLHSTSLPRIFGGTLHPFPLTVRIRRENGKSRLHRHDRHVTVTVAEFSRIGMTVHQQQTRIRRPEPRVVRQIKIPCHIDSRQGLEQDFFHRITLASDLSGDLGLKRGFLRHVSQHVQPERTPLFLFLFQLFLRSDRQNRGICLFIVVRDLPENLVTVLHIHVSLH